MIASLFHKNHLSEYFIREDGTVLKVKDGAETVVPVRPSKHGYLHFTVRNEDGKLKDFRPHQLVANAFIPNPLGLPEVNHVDGDKSNCAKGNLEWSTRRSNMEHASQAGLLSGRTSRYFGVSWYVPPRGRAKWRCQTNVAGRVKHIGYFGDDELAAAKAYNAFVIANGLEAALNEV